MNNKLSVYAVTGLAAILVAGGYLFYILGSRNLSVAPAQQGQEQATSTSVAPAKSTCSGPRQIGQEDLYSPGSITYTDASGKTSAATDECGGGGSQAVKNYCYENPFGSGNFVPGKVVYNCDLGCANGACKRAGASTGFSFPYPLSWSEGGTQFDVTGVSLGAVDATNLVDNNGKPYASGTAAYALTLKLKLTTDNSPACLPLNMARLLDEQGNLAAPNNTSFDFPDSRGPEFRGYCPSPNSIYENQAEVFVVPEGQTQFEFTTGGGSNIFFTAALAPDGSMQIQQESTSG